jgi:hypothetical protein
MTRALLPLAALGLLALSGCVGTPTAAPGEPVAMAPPGLGYTCYAGVYVCRLNVQVPIGSQCSCPGLGAPSYGTVR